MEELLIDTEMTIITPFGEYKIKIKNNDEKKAFIGYLNSSKCGLFIKVTTNSNLFHFDKVNYTF